MESTDSDKKNDGLVNAWLFVIVITIIFYIVIIALILHFFGVSNHTIKLVSIVLFVFLIIAFLDSSVSHTEKNTTNK